MGDSARKKTGHREITTHVSIHTIHLDGLRELYRHFLRLPDGAIVEVSLRSLEAAWPSGQDAGFAIRNPGFNSPLLTTSWICNTVMPSFNSSTTFVNSQLVSSLPLKGVLNWFMFDVFLY